MHGRRLKEMNDGPERIMRRDHDRARTGSPFPYKLGKANTFYGDKKNSRHVSFYSTRPLF